MRNIIDARLYQRTRSERGAIALHVAIGMIVLIAFLTFVVDYGVMWVGRRMAQNAADGGALAGAVAMAFDANGWTDRTTNGPARLAARQVALANGIWGP
jgi:Flp pilus assembly protein TadG